MGFHGAPERATERFPAECVPRALGRAYVGAASRQRCALVDDDGLVDEREAHQVALARHRPAADAAPMRLVRYDVCSPPGAPARAVLSPPSSATRSVDLPSSAWWLAMPQ